VGKHVVMPMLGRKIPVIADDYVQVRVRVRVRVTG